MNTFLYEKVYIWIWSHTRLHPFHSVSVGLVQFFSEFVLHLAFLQLPGATVRDLLTAEVILLFCKVISINPVPSLALKLEFCSSLAMLVSNSQNGSKCQLSPQPLFEPRRSSAGLKARAVRSRAWISSLPAFTWDDKSNWQGLCSVIHCCSLPQIPLFATEQQWDLEFQWILYHWEGIAKEFFYRWKSIPEHVSCDCPCARAPFTALLFTGLWRNLGKPQQAH